MLRIALLVVLRPVSYGGHAGVGRPDSLPIRLEVELAVGLREAVGEVCALEGERSVDPADLGHLGQRREAAAAQGIVNSFASVMEKLRCVEPSRRPNSRTTKLLGRACPRGSTSLGP